MARTLPAAMVVVPGAPMIPPVQFNVPMMVPVPSIAPPPNSKFAPFATVTVPLSVSVPLLTRNRPAPLKVDAPRLMASVGLSVPVWTFTVPALLNAPCTRVTPAPTLLRTVPALLNVRVPPM